MFGDFFSDAIEWGSKALFGSSGVDDLYDYAFDDPGLFEQGYDFVTDTAGSIYGAVSDTVSDAYEFLRTPAGGVVGSVAKSFLETDESGRPSKIDPTLRRSQARAQGARKSSGPSLADMGYVPRAIDGAIRAKNSKNKYVQNNMNLIGVNIGLPQATVTLSSATLSPRQPLTKKYQTKGTTRYA